MMHIILQSFPQALNAAYSMMLEDIYHVLQFKKHNYLKLIRIPFIKFFLQLKVLREFFIKRFAGCSIRFAF